MVLRATGRLVSRCRSIHSRSQVLAFQRNLFDGELPQSACLASLPYHMTHSRLQQAMWSVRQFHASAPALAVEEVLVPSMGDSITEGTIVGVAKAAGDAVAEDEVVAQIETDKVTIDVRAPRAGTLTEILVKDNDTVEVGQIVAKVDTDSGGGGSSGGSVPAQTASGKKKQQTEAQEPPKKQGKAEPVPKVGGQPSQSERPQPSGQQDERSKAAPQQSGRARMNFPPRRTEDGTRISDLPVAEAAHVLQQLSGGGGGSSKGSESSSQGGLGQPSSQGERESESEGVRRRRWAVGAPLPLDEDWQPAPGKWALSEREMEMIDLGGAEP